MKPSRSSHKEAVFTLYSVLHIPEDYVTIKVASNAEQLHNSGTKHIKRCLIALKLRISQPNTWICQMTTMKTAINASLKARTQEIDLDAKLLLTAKLDIAQKPGKGKH